MPVIRIADVEPNYLYSKGLRPDRFFNISAYRCRVVKIEPIRPSVKPTSTHYPKALVKLDRSGTILYYSHAQADLTQRIIALSRRRSDHGRTEGRRLYQARKKLAVGNVRCTGRVCGTPDLGRLREHLAGLIERLDGTVVVVPF